MTGIKLPSFLERLASHWLALASLVGLALGVVISHYGNQPYTWTLVLPLGLMFINLMAAIVTKPALYRQPALLVFHIGLLAVILLASLSRLTYLTGAVMIPVGEAFSGKTLSDDRGPWHPDRLGQLNIINEALDIHYLDGKRRHIVNRVRWRDESGRELKGEVGDDTPLVITGYRFYTTGNKGFHAQLLWQPPAQTQPVLVKLPFPSYPGQKETQHLEGQLEGVTEPVFIGLQLPEPLIPEKGPGLLHAPKDYHLVVRYQQQRIEIHPGQRVDFLGGHFELAAEGALGLWMGYQVFYDWTRPWLIASILLAVTALGFYVRNRFFTTPWLRESPPN